MRPSDFLRAVLPPEGWYCLTYIRKGFVKQLFTQDIEELAENARSLDQRHVDTYVALASFKAEGSREKEAAQHKKCFYIDVDCGPGKPYANAREGATDVFRFVRETGLPEPMIVKSGRGLHVYWLLTDVIDPDAWRLTARRLAKLCKEKGLHADTHCTFDVVRILRIPGTHNYKEAGNPREVKVLSKTYPIEFGVFNEALKTHLNGEDVAVEGALSIPGKPLSAASSITLIENRKASFKRILQKTIDGNGCSQLAYYIDHAAEEGMEPLWRGVLSLTKYCEEDYSAALKMSRLHPYEEERMVRKLVQIKGPYTCAIFDEINPRVCETCPRKGQLKSPIALGHYIAEAPAESVAPAVIDAKQGNHSVKVAQRPEAPFGFFYGEHGGIYKRGETDEELPKLVLPYDLYIADIGRSEHSGQIHLISNRHSRVQTHVLDSSSMISKDETLKRLAAENILAPRKGGDNLLHEYVRAAVGEFQRTRGDSTVPTSYGWQADGSFVVGEKRFSAKGVEAVASGPELINLASITRPKGSLEMWRNIVSLFVVKRRYDILFGMLTGFASPLMEFTGFTGCAVHMQSHRSGTGKSVSLALAASVFGHPTESRVSVESSAIATIHRMGLARSLLVPLDEVTKKTRAIAGANPSWMSEFLLSVTEGKGKERIDGNTITERKNTTRWKLIALLSSNTSLVDGLASSEHSVEGEMNRLIEVNVDQPLYLTQQEEWLLGQLDANYGVAGVDFISWCVKNKETVQRVVDECKTYAADRYKLSGPERYWHACVTAVLAAQRLMSTEYTGVMSLPSAPLEDFLEKQIAQQRKLVQSTERTAMDVLHMFLKENYPNLLIMRKIDSGITSNLGLVDIAEDTPTRSKVKGRIERGFTPNTISIYIDKKTLQQHCYATAFSSKAFLDELKQNYIVMTERKNLFSHTKAGASPRVMCIRIDIPETEWKEEEYHDE
jgi:hypothetical protein